jgi:DNA-binding CsgD family transcriptional regulator
METNSPGISLGKVRRTAPTLTNQSSDTEGTSLQANLARNLLQPEVKIPPPGLNRIPTREADTRPRREKLSPYWTSAGFVLMDSSLSPISYNAEAVEVLGYPDKPANPRRSDMFLAKICSTLLSKRPLGDARFVTEFRSGRRRYFCRAFIVDAHANDAAHPSIAVLLERGPSGLVPLSKISQQFNLTQREGEALAYLLQGMSSKEIANRMNISPNTVKAFMRMIMIKTRVSSRSAVFGKIIMTQTQ